VTIITTGARRRPAICCAPSGPGDGALWALDASTGSVLNGGKPLIYTSGPLRVPPTIDGNWVFVLDNNGDMYALTIDPAYAAISARVRSVDSRMLRQWEAPPR
jgi:outer membrane protein assembly factor BamB